MINHTIQPDEIELHYKNTGCILKTSHSAPNLCHIPIRVVLNGVISDLDLTETYTLMTQVHVNFKLTLDKVKGEDYNNLFNLTHQRKIRIIITEDF